MNEKRLFLLENDEPENKCDNDAVDTKCNEVMLAHIAKEKLYTTQRNNKRDNKANTQDADLVSLEQ